MFAAWGVDIVIFSTGHHPLSLHWVTPSLSLSSCRKKKSSKHKSGKDKSEAVPHDYDTHSLDLDMEGGEAGRERGGQRNTSPDGYDSNDEILATIAKV